MSGGSVLEVVDIGDLIEAVDLDELAEREDVGAATEEIGAAIGREFGAAIGRELGAVVARAIGERLSVDEAIDDAKDAVKRALRDLFVDPEVRTSLEEDIGSVVERHVSGDLIEGDAISSALGGEDEQAGEADRSEPDGTGDEEDGGSDEDTGTEATADESEEVTTREELTELSYRDLQSLAKEADVKANLSREEMTDQLAEALDLDEG